MADPVLPNKAVETSANDIHVDASKIPDIVVPTDIGGIKDVYAFEVRGDSLREVPIVNGDYVLVERTLTARQGEIVVGLVRDTGIILRRFYLEGNQVRLEPANIDMKTIMVPSEQLVIQGRVLGVLRRYI